MKKDYKSLYESADAVIIFIGKRMYKLEQENENLKKEVKQIGSAFIKKGDYARELEKENKELKALNKIICEDWSKEIKVYWAAFEEIREIAYKGADVNDCNFCNSIFEKINEVLQ